MQLYRTAGGIFHRGRTHFGEDAVDKLLEQAESDAEAEQIWNKWSGEVGQLSPLFQDIMETMARDDRGLGKFGL